MQSPTSASSDDDDIIIVHSTVPPASHHVLDDAVLSLHMHAQHARDLSRTVESLTQELEAEISVLRCHQSQHQLSDATRPHGLEQLRANRVSSSDNSVGASSLADSLDDAHAAPAPAATGSDAFASQSGCADCIPATEHDGHNGSADVKRKGSIRRLKERLQSLTQPLLLSILLLLLFLLFATIHQLTNLSRDKVALQLAAAHADSLLRISLQEAKAHFLKTQATAHEDYKQIRHFLEKELQLAVAQHSQDKAALQLEIDQAAAVNVVAVQSGAFIYTSLHQHVINRRERRGDGKEWRELPAGWDVAPGDDDDLRVCGAHPWQSSWLVFADGRKAGTGWWREEEPSRVGQKFSGETLSGAGFLQREGTRWRAKQDYVDVLLRKRV